MTPIFLCTGVVGSKLAQTLIKKKGQNTKLYGTEYGREGWKLLAFAGDS
jgi:hypothetical protein